MSYWDNPARHDDIDNRHDGAESESDWVPPNWWDEADIEHWKSLDHTFCTRYAVDFSRPAYETCVSTHCHLCGKSTSSQGHLDLNGNCPTPVDERKPWPTW